MIVAAADLLPALKERTAASNGEVLTFSDADALHALQTIMKRRPQVVALERMFAVTPRGAALINRIKADPTLRRGGDSGRRAQQRLHARRAAAGAAGAPALDQRGTRRAARFRMRRQGPGDGRRHVRDAHRPLDRRRADRVAGGVEAEPADRGRPGRREGQRAVQRVGRVDVVRERLRRARPASARASTSRTPIRSRSTPSAPGTKQP